MIVLARDMSFSPRRISAMVLRYGLLLKNSWPRLIELMYWPTVQMVLWGFISQFLYTNSSYVAQAFGVLLSAVILWDVMFRGQLGFSLSFMEEMWSRNMGHLFVSPLRPLELVISWMIMSLIRALIGIVPAVLLCIPLYHYNLFNLGLPLIGLFFNLIVMGWIIGLLVSGAILRLGMGAESLAWMSIFILAPVSAVYYPVAALPAWLQPIAWALPSAHAFEGMRSIIVHHNFEPKFLLYALSLNALYMIAAVGFFLYMVKLAREGGALLQTGE